MSSNTGSHAGTVLGTFGLLFGSIAFVLVLIIWIDPSLPTELSRARGRDPGTGQATGQAGTCPKQEKIWRIGFSRSWIPYKYADKDGVLHGLMVDIAKAVCAKQKKTCAMMVYKRYLCWNAHDEISPVLDTGVLDICAGFFPTPTRLLNHDFVGKTISEGPFHAHVFVKNDSKITALTDTHKIGFNLGSNDLPLCLEKNFHPVKVLHPVFAENIELWEKLMSGQIDAVFESTSFETRGGMKMIGGDNVCTTGGGGFMYRKGEDLTWFREGFKKIVEDGSYDRFCSTTYDGVKPACVKDPA